VRGRPMAQSQWTFSSVVGAPTGADGDGDALTNAPAPGPRSRWRAGLCECCSYPLSCLSTVFCEACVIGQTSSIALGGSRNVCLLVGTIIFVLGVLGFALQLVSEDAVTMAGAILSYVGAVVGLFFICYARVAIRERKNIEGSFCGDCCISFWCSACSICQMLNEHGRYRGFWDGYEVLDEEAGGAAGGKPAPATVAVATPTGVALVAPAPR